MAGSGRSSSFSSEVNTLVLEPDRFWNGSALYAASWSAIADFNSGSVANCRARRAAMTQVATCATVFSTLALSLGLRTRPGRTAAE